MKTEILTLWEILTPYKMGRKNVGERESHDHEQGIIPNIIALG